MKKTILSLQNDTVDLICWRHYGRTSGVVEAVLEANPALAEQGPILTIGTSVVLPEINTQQQTAQTISLWD
ncbi:tail protein X [Acinetobacter towneri]|uniref:tail protein X n=1 Tax=Acinetobacter towneri TaxID=202956 RepID=UPI003A8C6C52